MFRMIVTVLLLWLVAAPAAAGPVEDSLLEADRAFDALAARIGLPEAFRSVSNPDVRMLRTPPPGAAASPAEAAIVRTPTGVHAFMAAAERPGWSTRWAPTEAVASPDGRMGYTVGRWVRQGPGHDGKAQQFTGNYVTIWD